MPKNYLATVKSVFPEWSSSFDVCNEKMTDLSLGTSTDFRQSQQQQTSRMRSRGAGSYYVQPAQTTLVGRFMTGPFRVAPPSSSGRPTVYSGSTPLLREASPQHINSSSNVIRPGMKEVPVWLKSLRLHKYTTMFQELTYDQMMSLDEQTLESRAVTKGARRKIMQSIEKLKQRPEVLREIEMRLQQACNEPCCVKCAIATLRQMLATPIPFYSRPVGESDEVAEGMVPCSSINEKNIPAMIACVLAQVHSCVFSNGKCADVEDEYIWMLLTIYDKILYNEVFTAYQKSRVSQMKRFARKIIPSDLRRQRVNTSYTGKCDSCQKESQRVEPNMSRRGSYSQHKPFTMSPHDILKIQTLRKVMMAIDPKLLSLPPQDLQTICLMLEQHQMLQKQAATHQQQHLIMEQYVQHMRQRAQNLAAVTVWNHHQPCAPQVKLSDRSQDVDTKKPINPLFGPQPPYQPAFLKHQQPTNHSSTRTEQSVAFYPMTPPVSPSSQWASAVYDSKDLLNLCSPSPTSTENVIPPEVMPIGQWIDVARELEENQRVKKDHSHVFPSHESTSGYSSGGSDRGSGAGSPRAERDHACFLLSDHLDNVPGLFHSTTWAFANSF